MVIKKQDALVLVFSVAVLIYVLRDHLFYENVWRENIEKKGYQIALIVNERNCVECIQKTLCSFNDILEGLNSNKQQSVRGIIFFVTSLSSSFDRGQLNQLCVLPEPIVFCSEAELRTEPRLATGIPTFFLLKDGLVLYEKPVFVNTDMKSMEQELFNVYADLETFAFQVP